MSGFNRPRARLLQSEIYANKNGIIPQRTIPLIAYILPVIRSGHGTAKLTGKGLPFIVAIHGGTWCHGRNSCRPFNHGTALRCLLSH